ncbi:MAG: Gfo/Idh/MocA family oxidoreductase [Candidatus Omnitrophota bacterium]
MDAIKFGIFSTASINENGFIPFVERTPGAELAAVASRDAARAAEYARKHDIPKSYGSYEELLADGEVNCIYNPLPPSMHAEWSIRALEAGKHVLCEKPAALNAAEALEIKAKVEETGLVFAEAFHNRYHPVVEECLRLVREGEIGEVKSIRASFCIIVPDFSKIQYKPEMGGGALLDLGCYPVSFARWAAGCDEAVVPRAGRFRAPGGGVDLATWARLEFSSGVTARVRCSFLSIEPEVAVIRGSEGVITFLQYIHPVVEFRGVKLATYLLTVFKKSGIRNIRIESDSTYEHQLAKFSGAVRAGEQPLTNIDEAVANMRLLDAIAARAGA